MKLAVVNFKSVPDVEKNLSMMLQDIETAIHSNVDFIVFPELCLTGYNYYLNNQQLINSSKLAEVVNQLLMISVKHQIYICFGTPSFEQDKIYNSAYITCPDHTVNEYRKIHLYGDEHKIFTKGTEPLILETKDGKIGFGICYDTTSFPELIRYYAYSGVNLYVNLTALTLYGLKDSRDYLKRILEYHVQCNGIYIANANVCGVQDQMKYLGGSCVIGPDYENEILIKYYCNSTLSTKKDIFITEIEPSENLRFIYDGNRFNPIPDFNIELYKKWYK